MLVKTYHYPKMMSQNSDVSPLCAKIPKALNLTTDSWTWDKTAITCSKCIRILGGKNDK